jgi:hypothetical protein
MARDDGASNARPLRRPPTIRIDHRFRGGGREPPAPSGDPFPGGLGCQSCEEPARRSAIPVRDGALDDRRPASLRDDRSGARAARRS